MYRTKRLVVRLSNEESQIINRLARAERLPVSTLTRRLLLCEAEKKNFGNDDEGHHAKSQ